MSSRVRNVATLGFETTTMTLTYTETPPNRLGYYWLKLGPLESIVNVLTHKDFGGRLVTMHPEFKQWVTVDKFSDGTETVLWAGPIQPPVEKH